uniref:Leucine rich repeat containing 34 n=1 Tax=Leptobrachium leishanense TaxID=445787 RepID=A0A8C5PU53_9ANUR
MCRLIHCCVHGNAQPTPHILREQQAQCLQQHTGSAPLNTAIYNSGAACITAMSENLTQHYVDACQDLNQPVNSFIAEMLSQAEHLQPQNSTLKICGNNRLVNVKRVTDENVLALCRVLDKNGFIRDLDLKYNNITDNGAMHIANFLKVNSSLLSLNLMGNDIGTSGAEHISKALFDNESLKSLRMTGNKIGNKGGMFFASMLQINSTLEDLDLGDCDLEDTTIHISKMLKVNSTLQEIHLSKHEMTDFGIERLCEAMHENVTLKYLDISCNKITRDGVKCLAKLLKANTALEIVDLTSNRMEDDGAMYLAEAIGLYNRSLKALSIVSNNITGKGLKALAASLKANDCLMYIYIWGNKLDENACMAFADLLYTSRLAPSSTDVQPYIVDGRVHLAELSHGLRTHYYWTPSYGSADNKACNSTIEVLNNLDDNDTNN